MAEQDWALEPGWLLSPAGRPYLDSILHKNQRRVFSLLERPALPPALAVPTVTYKLFLAGRSGVGKTALVAWLAGTPGLLAHHETLGIEATTVFWPAKPRGSGRPVLFQLHLWDCGDGALRKFEHLLPACKEEADAALFLFSFTDRASFEELPALMDRVLGPGDRDIIRMVVGTKFAPSDFKPLSAWAARERSHLITPTPSQLPVDLGWFWGDFPGCCCFP
ncbi:ciliogenesis and planar polarity effector 2 isoform X2 [Poecile atricapillus]|uniref:ciliogenesis and planar polarity effector 2 isoform X2 n=1 Tax=Poecile atricapillus TaxID=48891 RepID=UPI0027395F2C|nr:ciliogenesis and planar polarity effector 2 isoform X2 [Poecile atricapillus]